MQHDQALIERLVPEFIAGYMSYLQQQENELREAISQLDEQYAWAKAREHNVLARAYRVGQAELLRRLADVKALIYLIDGEQ